MRSGVNCTRLKSRSRAAASALTRSVLATPGTPSSRTWPRTSSATTRPVSTASWPTTTLATSSRTRSTASRGSVLVVSVLSGTGDLLADRFDGLGEDNEVFLARGGRSAEGGAYASGRDASARRRRVGNPVRRRIRRKAEPVGEGATQVVAQQSRGLRPAPCPLKQVAHRGHQLGPGDVHGLSLEHGTAQAPSAPQHDDRERDGELQQRQLHARADEIGERTRAITGNRRLQHRHTAGALRREKCDREKAVVDLAERALMNAPAPPSCTTRPRPTGAETRKADDDEPSVKQPKPPSGTRSRRPLGTSTRRTARNAGTSHRRSSSGSMKPTGVRPVGRVMEKRDSGSATTSVPPRRTQSSTGWI